MEPLLILHGWGSFSGKWNKVKEILEKKGHKVFLPDLPGFGENQSPINSWSIDDYSEWLNEFCEKNNLSQIFLLGHSFGGAVATKFSLKHPEKINKMFLLASSGIRKKTFKKSLFKKLASFFKIFSALPFYPLIRKIFYKIFADQTDYFSHQENKIMKETYLKVIGEDISSLFSLISVPTIIIWGEKDRVVSLKDAYFIKNQIKDSHLEIISGAGHSLQIEVPEILTEKILNFI